MLQVIIIRFVHVVGGVYISFELDECQIPVKDTV